MMDASRHRCLIYDGHPSEQLPVIVPLLMDGLRGRKRCLYLGNPAMISMVDSALSSKGVDVTGEVRRGALVLSSDRGHLKNGGFDPQAMVAMLRELIAQAVKDGYKGLCATGDMMWELGTEKNFERLREYEARLEQVFEELPLNGICQYHREAVPPRAIRDALLTHRTAYVGTLLNEDNLFYVPPELLLEEPDEEALDRRADWMWRQISRIVLAQEERDRTLDALRASEAKQRELAERLAAANEALEARVRDRTAELQSLNEELEAFSFSVSHDLQAPLRAVDGFARSALEGLGSGSDAGARSDLGRVLAASGRMSRLIEGLLTLARMARGEIKRETVDLSAEARGIVADLHRAEPFRKVEAVVQPGLKARGDPRLLAAALSNLLGNAWKYTSKSADARIEFGAEEGKDGRVYFVRDNGVGFDMAYKAKLFKAFERLHSAEEFPGSGVGLATAYRILARHQGTLRAESEPGRGAVFYFTLPA